MKNSLLRLSTIALLLTPLFFLSGCSKLRSITLHKTYSDIDFTIPAPQTAGTFELDKVINADLQSLAASYGFDISKIESASINSISLIISDTNAVPVTFSIVDSASCSFSADGVTVVDVGSDDAVHTSPTQLDFDLKGIDVSPYLKATTFHAKMRLTTHAPISHDVPMKASIQCTFKVTPFK